MNKEILKLVKIFESSIDGLYSKLFEILKDLSFVDFRKNEYEWGDNIPVYGYYSDGNSIISDRICAVSIIGNDVCFLSDLYTGSVEDLKTNYKWHILDRGDLLSGLTIKNILLNLEHYVGVR